MRESGFSVTGQAARRVRVSAGTVWIPFLIMLIGIPLIAFYAFLMHSPRTPQEIPHPEGPSAVIDSAESSGAVPDAPGAEAPAEIPEQAEGLGPAGSLAMAEAAPEVSLDHTAMGVVFTDDGQGGATFSWLRGVQQVGTYLATLTARDARGDALETSQTIRIEILDNAPPELDVTVEQPAPTTTTSGKLTVTP